MKSAIATATAIGQWTPKVTTATMTATRSRRKAATAAIFTRKRMRTSA